MSNIETYCFTRYENDKPVDFVEFKAVGIDHANKWIKEYCDRAFKPASGWKCTAIFDWKGRPLPL